MDTEKRLEELLDKKDDEIRDLERRLKELENAYEFADWRLMVHTSLTEQENMGLPIPRLELRYGNGTYGENCIYSLVYKHACGGIVRVPLSVTTWSGFHERPKMGINGKIYTPIRDGYHITQDYIQLNLPAFVIDGEEINQIISGKQVPFNANK